MTDNSDQTAMTSPSARTAYIAFCWGQPLFCQAHAEFDDHYDQASDRDDWRIQLAGARARTDRVFLQAGGKHYRLPDPGARAVELVDFGGRLDPSPPRQVTQPGPDVYAGMAALRLGGGHPGRQAR